MARLNIAPRFTEMTHEDAPAARMTALQALRRSVMSCLLWENEFYEDGEEIAERIVRLAGEVPPGIVAGVAVEARNRQHLRHVPLLLLAAADKHGGRKSVGEALPNVIRRADELAEFLSVLSKVNGVPASEVRPKLSAQVKKGLARAVASFDAYQLAKYDRDGAIKLRDVLRLVHPRPADAERSALYAKVVARELDPPDTWEVALSRGADKRETFTRLLSEGRLGYLALLRNLRGMTEAGVDLDLIRGAILARKGADRVLPFRYVAAARACPQLEPELDEALCAAIEELPLFNGHTIVLVDVSGSMEVALSARSDMKRADAAGALASMIRAQTLRVMTFSERVVEVPPRRGMAGVDAVRSSQEHGWTRLGGAVEYVNDLPHDRLIVITDEQSHDVVPNPVAPRAYMINVASARNGVGYGRWTHVDGWSESVLRFIAEAEAAQ